MTRVLVVDDDRSIRRSLEKFLTGLGHDVVTAADGPEALRAAGGADVVLLDLGLPGIDGLEVIRRLRAFLPTTPIVVVSAWGDDETKVAALDLGADDYVTKPFSARELVLRVKALLRRPRAAGAAPIAADGSGLHLDPERREVTVDGAPVSLSALEFDLLAALAGAAGRVFTRRQLLERVWGFDYYGDERVVDVHIRNLRRALGDDADSPRFVATVRGVGYKYAGGAS